MFVADARDSFASPPSSSDWNTFSAAGKNIGSGLRPSDSQHDSESPAGNDQPPSSATSPNDIRTSSKAAAAPAQSDVASCNKHGTEVLQSDGGVSSVSGGIACVDIKCKEKEEVGVRDGEEPSSPRSGHGRTLKPFRYEQYVVSGEIILNTRWW